MKQELKHFNRKEKFYFFIVEGSFEIKILLPHCGRNTKIEIPQDTLPQE
jgi:hypothetical protein